MNTVDDEWLSFLQKGIDKQSDKKNNNNLALIDVVSINNTNSHNIPKCDELYISTKTKVLFLI